MRATALKRIKKDGDKWDGKRVVLVKKEKKKAQCKLANSNDTEIRWFYCNEIQ